MVGKLLCTRIGASLDDNCHEPSRVAFFKNLPITSGDVRRIRSSRLVHHYIANRPLVFHSRVIARYSEEHIFKPPHNFYNVSNLALDMSRTPSGTQMDRRTEIRNRIYFFLHKLIYNAP